MSVGKLLFCWLQLVASIGWEHSVNYLGRNYRFSKKKKKKTYSGVIKNAAIEIPNARGFSCVSKHGPKMGYSRNSKNAAICLRIYPRFKKRSYRSKPIAEF